MNKILILGASGMLGSSIFRYFTACHNFKVVGTIRNSQVYHHLFSRGYNNLIQVDNILDKNVVSEIISAQRPDYVINCIGLIKQLNESKSFINTIEINSLYPHILAELCTKFGSKLIHFSTDCVFSGERGLYKEIDLPDSAELYGRSKLLGEVDYDDHLTLRTSIIGHEYFRCLSLVDWFLSQKQSVKGFSKAIFSGLPTVYIAELLHKYILSRDDLRGLYHLSVAPIDKFHLLTIIKKQYDHPVTIVKDESFSIDRSLDSSNLCKFLDISHPDWNSLVSKMFEEYKRDFK